MAGGLGMDKMREEFERYVTHNFSCTDDSLNRTHMNIYYNYVCSRVHPYDSVSVLAMWQAWQASRAALVVELPETCCRTLIFEQDNSLEVGMEHGEYYDPDDIHAALDKAGIKYE